MSSTRAFVPAAPGAAGTDASIFSGTTAQQQPSQPSKRSAEIPNDDEEIAAIGSSFSTSLRIASPPEIPALPDDLGRLVFFGDVGAVVVTSATSASTATGNHMPLPPTGGKQSGVFEATSTTFTGTQTPVRSARISSNTSTMTAFPSPSLTPRRSPYVPPSLFLPAATGKSSSTSTATTAVSTPGTTTPILLSRASSFAIHHQQPHDDGGMAAPSILTTVSPLSTGASSTPPRTIIGAPLSRVVFTTPKTNGTSSAASRVPGAPEKKKAGPDEIFTYERHAKAGPFAISPELLVVAEQEWMEVGITSEAGNVPTHGYKPLIHTNSLDALALAASTEDPKHATPLPSTSTAADEFDNQRPTTSHIMDRLTAALEALPSSYVHGDMHPLPPRANPPKAKTSKKKKKKVPSKMDQQAHRAAPESTPVSVGNMSRRQILSAIPEPVKNRFRELGFAQWGKNMFFPVIELSPYDIPLDDVREEWMAEFERSRKGSRKMHRLVYWYGSNGLNGAFSLIAPSKIVDYDTGVRNSYHLIPNDLQFKIDQGRVLSQDEHILVRGLEVIERERKLVSKDRAKCLLEESISTKKTPASTSTTSSNGIDEKTPAAKTANQRTACKAANTQSEHGHFRVGQKILKNFPGYKEPFFGEITLLPTADFAYYRVSYEDGDQEDISIDDISKHVAMYHFSNASAPIKDAKFKIGQIIEKKFPGFGRFRGKIVKLPSLGKNFYRVKYQDNDIEDIASDEIGKYVIHDLASKKPLVAAKTSPKRKKKESNASHEMTRRVRPKISSTVERFTRVHD